MSKGAELAVEGAIPERPSVYVYDPLDQPVDWLVERGVQVTLGAPLYSPGRSRPKVPPEDLVAGAQGHAALLGASGAYITAEVMEALPTLRCIAKLGIGYEVIDVAAATELGILVTNTPVHGEVGPVAEHAVALMLALARRLSWYDVAYVRRGGWRDPDHMAVTLDGATVGIVGFGNIGRAVAQRLSGWGCRILAADPVDFGAVAGVERVELPELLAAADIVTLHTPGRSKKEGPLLDERHLALMKPGALLVNTARGNLVDQPSLVAHLASGHLGGAAVDVYSPEPPRADAPLLSAPNVIATPHVAAWSPQVRKEMVMTAFRDLWTALRGGIPEHLVNPEVLDGARR